MPKRRATSFMDDRRLGRRLRWIVSVYLVLIAVIVGFNVSKIAEERGAALAVNVAARQRALAERYTKDVLLRSQGIAADPADDAAQLLANADALLNGGDVISVQGADEEVHISRASTDWRVITKLTEERRLIVLLVETGSDLLDMGPAEPGFSRQVLQLRIIGGQVTSVSNDAVGQMTLDTEAAFGRLVGLGIALGALGALVAVVMGLLLRRAGARRSARFRSLVDHASDLITVVDGDGRIRYQSPSLEGLVGIAPDAVVDTPYIELADEPERASLHSMLANLGAEGGPATAEYRLRHADGSWRSVESIITDLTADPSVGGIVLNTRDVTDRKALEEELAHQAFHDSLTGLSNRAVFRDRVDHALARSARLGTPLTVLLLDLDGFKTINDSLGHEAGDELLIAVAARILACGRESDTVARLGGDEFGILLEDEGDERRATQVAHRVLQAVSEPYDVRGREIFVRASIGIAFSSPGTDTTDDLIRNADAAMYAAKAAGRDRYQIFEPAMHARALARFEVHADLQRALDRGELAVYYQPIVEFSTGAVKGVEALVRWLHPTRGVLAPIEFIGVAEDTGLIVPLGRWVLNEACRQIVEWRSNDPDASTLMVSVNLSTRQLLEPDIVLQVQRVLEETGLDPAALTLELTEGSLMQDVADTAVKLRALKHLGVRLAIDDFGTGSSSLAYLKHFPIDLLKIDKSFVEQITTEESEGSALVRTIIELAQTFELDTVAEGIEAVDQLDELRSAGCRSGQGYLFARPLDGDAMEGLLHGGRDTLGPARDVEETGAARTA
jgi:diguanylate cyclase (GGDEF)-like protein/PAS domain S-box-containing protein